MAGHLAMTGRRSDEEPSFSLFDLLFMIPEGKGLVTDGTDDQNAIAAIAVAEVLRDTGRVFAISRGASYFIELQPEMTLKEFHGSLREVVEWDSGGLPR